MKVARPVLRGESGGNAADVLDSNPNFTDMNIFSFIHNFPDDNACITHFKVLSEQNELVCTKCGGKTYYMLRNKLSYECKRCHSRQALCAGTVIQLLLILISLISSCDNKKDNQSINVIPLEKTVGNYKTLNLSDYATDIKYIPLETNDLNLISDINRIIYENGKILILECSSGKDNCYLFDNNGMFCCKIGHWGQGPEDYQQISDVSIHDNYIYLFDWNKILIYDSNGHLVEIINLQLDEIPLAYRESSLRRILPLKKDAFVVTVVTMRGYYPTAFLFEFFQSNIKQIKEYPSYMALDKNRGGFSTDELGDMYHFADDIRIYKVINDTIFTIGQNLEIKDAFIFELGQYKPPHTLLEMEDGITNFVKNNKNFIFPNTIYESLFHLYIRFDFGIHAPTPFEYTNNMGIKHNITIVCGVYDKRTGELTLMSQPEKGKLGFKNDIDNGSVIWPHYISSNNELVTYITVEDFLDHYEKTKNPLPQMTEIAKRVDFDDNQIVIVAKLKKL